MKETERVAHEEVSVCLNLPGNSENSLQNVPEFNPVFS